MIMIRMKTNKYRIEKQKSQWNRKLIISKDPRIWQTFSKTNLETKKVLLQIVHRSETLRQNVQMQNVYKMTLCTIIHQQIIQLR